MLAKDQMYRLRLRFDKIVTLAVPDEIVRRAIREDEEEKLTFL